MENELSEARIRLVVREGDPLYSSMPMDSPTAAVNAMSQFLKDMDRELFCVVNLDSQYRPINYNVTSIGNVNSSLVAPANVFKTAILCNSSYIMLFHNHPSGVLTPSRADDITTKHLIEGGKLLGIPVVDHIIVNCEGNYFSYHKERSDEFDFHVSNDAMIGESQSDQSFF